MLPAAPPQLPKWPFLVGDAALIGLAWLLVSRSSPLSQPVLVAAVVCVVLGSILAAIPYLVDYARRQEEALDERQRALEGLSRTIASSAEQISIAATGLQGLTEAFKRHQEQVADLTTRVLAMAAIRPAPAPEPAPFAVERPITPRPKRNGNSIPKTAPVEPVPEPTPVAAVAAAPAVSAAPAAPTVLEGPAAPEGPVVEVRREDPPVAPPVDELPLAPAEPPAPASVVEPTPPAPEPVSVVEPAPIASADIPEVAPVAPSDSSSPTPPRKRAPRKPRIEPPEAAGSTPPVSSPVESVMIATEPAVESRAEPASRTTQSNSPVEVPVPRTAADGATRLIVTAYIGIGNRLFIRGEGGGLTWDKGVPLQFVSIGKWRWEASDPASPVTFKLYKNDEQECAALGQQTLAPGAEQELKAAF